MVGTALVILLVAIYIVMNAACIGFFARSRNHRLITPPACAAFLHGASCSGLDGHRLGVPGLPVPSPSTAGDRRRPDPSGRYGSGVVRRRACLVTGPKTASTSGKQTCRGIAPPTPTGAPPPCPAHSSTIACSLAIRSDGGDLPIRLRSNHPTKCPSQGGPATENRGVHRPEAGNGRDAKGAFDRAPGE
jgi:hypothetical protein